MTRESEDGGGWPPSPRSIDSTPDADNRCKEIREAKRCRSSV
jgi:hypothetical protein